MFQGDYKNATLPCNLTLQEHDGKILIRNESLTAAEYKIEICLWNIPYEEQVITIEGC